MNMKKLLLIPFMLLTVLSMAACTGGENKSFFPNNRKHPNNRTKETIIIPIRRLPAVTDVIWYFMLHVQATQNEWHSKFR